MASFSYLRSQAANLQSGATNPDVQALAEIVKRLASECESVEKLAKEAADEARRAKNAARSK